MIKAAITDPGFIPRGAQDPTILSNSKQFLKKLIINGGQNRSHNVPMEIKFCSTCLIYRPPRSVHCAICDACVLEMDHHCPWISQCVGKRNYRWFMLFALTLWVDCVFVIIVSACELYQRGVSEGWYGTLKLAFCTIAIAFISLLVGYHSKIIIENKTTNEDLKKFLKGYVINPWGQSSVVENFKIRVRPLHKFMAPHF